MGKLIDADEYQKEMFRVFSCNNSDDRNIRRAVELGIASAPPVEAIPKADYEARLKADLVAILTDIQLKIEEQKYRELTEDECGFKFGIHTASNTIQQKINALKENKDESI